MIKPFTFYLIIIIICTSFFSSTLGVSTISIHNEEMVGLPLLRSSESSYINQPEVSDPVVTESISKITGRIQVSIFDYKTSKALSAAVVTIYQITEKGQVKIATGETDSSGFYEATGIAHGNYNVTVEKATYQSESKLVILRTDYDRIIVNIYLSKAPLNSGYIEVYGLIANTKIPLKGAKVALYDATGILITSMVLNDVGFANITKLAVNKYILYISLKGYVSQKKEVAIDFIGDSEKVKFYLEPVGSGNGFIEVSVSDVVRNALSGAQVTIYNSSMDIIDAQKTNKVGFVNVTNLELGTYNVSVSLSGFSSHFQITEIDYPGDGDRLYFTLLESTGNGFILGQVMTESGEPILNAAVEVHSAKKILLYTLSTDTDGIFNVTDLIIGQTYYIFVSKDGYVSDYAIVKLEVIGFARVAIFLVKELGNDGFFELYVKNSTYFLADAYVEVYNAAGTLLNSYFTDTNGFINITNLVVGLYHFYILKDGYLVERTSGMISFDGDSDVITIILRNEPTSLPATGIIDVYVKDEDDLPIKGAYVRVVGEIAYSGYTGEKGEYSVKELYLGLYNITVSMKGYSDGTASTRIDYVGDRDRVYITLYPEETTSIRLYTSIPGKLDQIGGSYVRYKLDDGSFSKWFLTDESGQFEISNAKIGTYTIEILRGGFELQTQTVAVSEIGVIINAGTVLDIHAADGVTDYYALIVAGQIDRRFTIDAFAMYAILQNYYGFSSQKMYLLTPRTHHPISNNELPYDRLTSKANVEWAIGEIAFYADADDKVLVWWTGHGGYDSMDTHTNTISAAEFAAALDSVICEEMCIYLGPCHSGSFIGDLNDEANRAIYTSCASNEGGHATYDHSYWPWATYTAIHPLTGYSDADDNSNGYISMFEIFDYAYDYITITKGYTDQHPQRWVGADVDDLDLYPGDGIPTSGIVESSLSYLVMSNGNEQGDLYDGTPEVDIIASASVLDNEFDNDDFSFQAINSSDPHQSLVSNVTIDVYFLNGTLYASDKTDSEGMVTFYDVPINDYAWEAIYQNLEVDSGHLVSDGYTLSVYAHAENWDHQGDHGDIRFNAEESASHIFAPDVVITLYRNDGTILESGTTDYIGAVYFYDFTDGSYAWEAIFEGNLVDEGIISIDSSLFTLETDDIAPIVSIQRPTSGEVIKVTENDLILEYTVIERNNYTIEVLLNGVSIGFKSNGSKIGEITENGEYFIRVVATDIAGNTHYDEVSVKVEGYPPTTTSESLTPTTESTVSEPSYGFEFIYISSLLVFLLVVKRRKKEA